MLVVRACSADLCLSVSGAPVEEPRAARLLHEVVAVARASRRLAPHRAHQPRRRRPAGVRAWPARLARGALPPAWGPPWNAAEREQRRWYCICTLRIVVLVIECKLHKYGYLSSTKYSYVRVHTSNFTCLIQGWKPKLKWISILISVLPNSGFEYRY